MPLPENWNGVFYGPGQMDDTLIDLEPERFVDMLAEHTGDDLQDFVFLVGGAYLDLRLHGKDDRAEAVLKAAECRNAAVPWNFFRTRTPGVLNLLGTTTETRIAAGTAIRARMDAVANTLASAVARLATTAGAEREQIAAQLKRLGEDKP